ncbi:ABC transporter permease [Paenibacillus beijingensis]|uniref:ABC transporter permease n=1 Tax=Paenibacillus beijingensis TaxID=1126833 RepID=A0A0D5NQ51_9BACL|nr:ABC transporter permease [Paenibacillus beijingensis]
MSNPNKWRFKWRLNSQSISVSLTLIALLVIWQLLYLVFSIPEYLVPSPISIAERFIQDAGPLMTHSSYTLGEVLLGFFLSVIIGIPIAILIVHSKYFANTIYPILIGIHCIPMVALAPLLVIWFGYELKTKVLIVFLISFFPVVINAVVGLQSMDKEMYRLGRSMRASELQIFTYFRLPKALPSMFGGFKVGITLSVVGAVVAEFVASSQGIGYLQLVANSQLDTTLEFCALFILAVMGIGLFYIVHFLERLAMPWYQDLKRRS